MQAALNRAVLVPALVPGRRGSGQALTAALPSYSLAHCLAGERSQGRNHQPQVDYQAQIGDRLAH